MIEASKRTLTAAYIREHSQHNDGIDWGAPIEQETRRRIQIAVAAYAYEIEDKPIMSDNTFDRIAQRINKHMGTCHPDIDEFFVVHFSPMTGMWIHQHPELAKIKALFHRYYSGITLEYYENIRRRGLELP
jgi:hypothetical protein